MCLPDSLTILRLVGELAFQALAEPVDDGSRQGRSLEGGLLRRVRRSSERDDGRDGEDPNECDFLEHVIPPECV